MGMQSLRLSNFYLMKMCLLFIYWNVIHVCTYVQCSFTIEMLILFNFYWNVTLVFLIKFYLFSFIEMLLFHLLKWVFSNKILFVSFIEMLLFHLLKYKFFLIKILFVSLIEMLYFYLLKCTFCLTYNNSLI